MVFFAIWAVAIIDAFSTAFGSGGILNGKWFLFAVILTFLAPVIYYIYDFSTRSRKQKKIEAVEEEAALMEPRREQEIREILKENPGFLTLCYQCIHFNPNLRHCARQLSDDITYQRIKEVKINDRKYCLYWIASNDQPVNDVDKS